MTSSFLTFILFSAEKFYLTKAIVPGMVDTKLATVFYKYAVVMKPL
jgi:hypothetical protein